MQATFDLLLIPFIVMVNRFKELSIGMVLLPIVVILNSSIPMFFIPRLPYFKKINAIIFIKVQFWLA